MSYYPIFIDLKGKKVIVVGGGTVAQRKIETLLDYGAAVEVIARKLSPALNRYVKEGRVKLLGREFKESHLNGAHMVMAATDDHALNRQISIRARKKGLLINAADQPSECSFIVPSILRRGDLLIAISTSGKSPALARRIREELEKQYGSEYEILLILMGRLRKEILSRGLSQEENSRMFHKIIDSHILEAIGRKDWMEVASILRRIVQIQLSADDIIKLLNVTGDHGTITV